MENKPRPSLSSFTGVCVDYTHDGQGIVKNNGKPVFVYGLLLGEEAEIQLTYEKSDYCFGKIVKITKISPDRIQPLCPVATACGGCCFQNLRYPAQLAFKKHKIEEAFKRIGGMTITVDEPIGMDNPYYYRNKTQMPVAKDRQGKIISGFYKAKSHDIVPIDKCYIENKNASHILTTIKKLMKEIRVEPYDEDARTGVLRHILIRASYYKPEIMVVLVTNVDVFPGRNNFCKELHKECPEITTIVQNINTRDTNVILGEKEYTLMGKGFIVDTLCGITFQISSRSFYQINPTQTEKLYGLAIEKAELKGTERVLDAYCGIGTIGLVASKHVKSVLGVEVVQEAIMDAKKNARNNGITNATFVTADASDFVAELAKNHEHFDVVFLDPPRSGAEEKFLSNVLTLSPAKIVYVSCDSATLARDVKFLSTKYDVKSVTPVDMFPQTSHIEIVTLLTLK